MDDADIGYAYRSHSAGKDWRMSACKPGPGAPLSERRSLAFGLNNTQRTRDNQQLKG